MKNDRTLDESIVTALDGSDPALLPFFPYILQDLWEMGSDPEIMIELVRKHTRYGDALSVLDLGCGKGPVSIRLAKEFQCRCTGIDAVDAFIEEAKQKAGAWGVAHRCVFEKGDIRERLKDLPVFDVIIFGSIGPVLGNFAGTLSAVSPCLNPDGIVIIDDGYLDDQSAFEHPRVERKSEVLRQINEAGMTLIDEVVIERARIEEEDGRIFRLIKQRCEELIEKHPGRKDIFLKYIDDQHRENHALEHHIICSAMVIKRNA